MRVLVTGGTGFLGRHVVRALETKGHDLHIPQHSPWFDLCDQDDVRWSMKVFNPEVVIHCAALVGGIGANQARPAEFFYDNLMMGAQLMHEAYRAGVQKFVNIGTVCFTPETTITTRNGVKLIPDVEVGDIVLSHDGTLNAVTKTFMRDFVGGVRQITARAMPAIRVTAEHPIWVSKTGSMDDLEWRDAKNIKPGEYLFVPRIAKVAKQDIPGLNDELCELLGLFVAEGGVSIVDTNSRGSRFTVYFSFGDEPELIDRTQELMARYFGLTGAVRKMPNQRGYQVSFNNEDAAYFFAEACYVQAPHLSFNKRVPPFVPYLPHHKIVAFLRGYYNGDGCYSVHQGRHKVSFGTVSPTLSWQTRTLLGEIGILGLMYQWVNKTATILGRAVNVRKTWNVWVSSTEQAQYFVNIVSGKESKEPTGHRARYRKSPEGFFIEVLQNEAIEYQGPVYNLEVENTHTYVANGVAVHNCMYPEVPPRIPFTEDDLWAGYPEPTNASYGIAKRALLTMAQAYRQQYGFNAITLIPTNLYGPGDSFDPERSHVIPALIRKFVEAKETGAQEVVVWGTGNATREFLYVEDAAEAICRAAEVYDSGEPVNLGGYGECSIRVLASMIAAIVGFNGEIVYDHSKPDGQPRRVLNIDRAVRALNWEPFVHMADGLQRTVDWYKENRR